VARRVLGSAQPSAKRHARRMTAWLRDPRLMLWRLIAAQNRHEIGPLEASTGSTQRAAVDYIIEQSDWRSSFPGFVGGNGTPAARLGRCAPVCPARDALPCRRLPQLAGRTPLTHILCGYISSEGAEHTSILSRQTDRGPAG